MRSPRRLVVFAYGVVVYAAFFVFLRYFVCFLEDRWISRRIDRPSAASLTASPTVSLAVDLGLLALFAVQHSVMARARFKRWLTTTLPAAVERSTYVLASTLTLALLVWQWRPLPRSIFTLSSPPARLAVIALSYGGWILASWATWVRGHAELFGLHQVNAVRHGRAANAVPLATRGPYRVIRHPMYVGALIGCWAAPTMTLGHLLLALGLTLYVDVGARLEERDLLSRFADEYRRYQMRVGRLVPLLGRRRAKAAIRPGG